MNGYPSLVSNNTCTLVVDGLYNATQQGINVVNTQNAMVVTTNTVTGASTTSTLGNLMFFGSNAGTNSPSVACNVLSNSYQAFVFDNANTGTSWRGNTMNTHTRGLVLVNTATIGTQGSSGNPQDNQWLGTWTGGNNGTYVDGSSDAVNSKLWTKTTTGFFPPNWGGPIPSQTYSLAVNTPTTIGAFSCGGGGGGSGGNSGGMVAGNTSANNSSNLMATNNSAVAPTAEQQYINETGLYRYFNANPSVKNNNMAYSSFYNAKQNSSIDKFMQVENNLYNGQTTLAQSNNNAITASNAIEGNYKTFYNLYAKYIVGTFTSADSIALSNLGNLCAGQNGAVIYQARALYNAVNKTVKVFNENCTTTVANNARFTTTKTNEDAITNNWSVDLFPNPNKGSFSLVSKTNSETLNVVITDITGKIIFNKILVTTNFITNLEVVTNSGIYLVTIKNSLNETTTKKLVITN